MLSHFSPVQLFVSLCSPSGSSVPGILWASVLQRSMCSPFHVVDLSRLKTQNTLGRQGGLCSGSAWRLESKTWGLGPWSCHITSVGLSIILVSRMEVKTVLPALVGLYPEVSEPMCMEQQAQGLVDSCSAVAMNSHCH